MEWWGAWGGIVSSSLILSAYELYSWRVARRDPTATARSAHRVLRAEWVRALSRQAGSELLAVQALRNSLMSATITASTAAISAMGATSLIVSNPGATRGWFDLRLASSRSVLELALLATLFIAYGCSAMAARYYHHSGFLMSLPVGSPERTSHETTAVAYVQRAGVLYSWSLRCFLFLAPIVAGMLSSLLMLPVALSLVALLHAFDGAPTRT